MGSKDILPARILVVDDDEQLRWHYRRLLTHAGYQVKMVFTGEEALTVLAVESLDLVLLDIHMPGIGGLGVLRELQHRGDRPPVLIITGSATVPEAVEATQLGASGVIQKGPPAALLALIAEILAAHQSVMIRLIRWIRTSPGEVGTRLEVARQFEVCPRTVTNWVRRSCNQSFQVFLQSCRVEVACRLLVTTDLEMKEVAAQVGFRSLRDMDRVFRLHKRCTPREYRQQVRALRPRPAE